MRCADFRRSEYTRRNSVAHLFQLWSDDAESFIEVVGDVLEQAPLWANLSHNSGDLGPQPPGVSGPAHEPSDALSLAGVAANDAVHNSTIACAVEGSKVSPDRSRVHRSRFNSLRQHADGRSFPLHVSERAASWVKDSESKVQATDS